tara:strand:- start:68 stop:1153 length:1086 start_codon:yes stop_codon:yes gene_type:complete
MQTFKTYLAEANTSKATLTEMAICYQYNVMVKNMSSEDALSSAEIDPQNFSKFSNLLDTGGNMVHGLLSTFPAIKRESKAVHYGGGNDKVTSDWSKYGAGAKAASRTPKTDLYIGKYNISLKMGAAQLMSGYKEEATATFYAALDGLKLDNTDEVKECLKLIEQFNRGITIGTTAQIIKDKSDKAVVEADKIHKQLMKKLSELFQSSPEFKKAFILEAMTGYKKFGRGSRAAADWFLVGNDTGSKVSFHQAEGDYLDKVVGASKVSVKMKSTSRDAKDAVEGERTWWSALGIGLKDMTKIKEDYELHGELLDEGIFRNIISKVGNVLKKATNKLKSFAKKAFGKFLDFLGFKPEVSYTIKF